MSNNFLNKTILVVEDDLISNENVSYVLKKHFNKVINSLDGEDAYEKFLKHKPDVVITDIEMPLMDGLTLIEKIRAVQVEAIPIIIMTSYTHQHYLLKALDLQPLCYEVKPLVRSSFKNIIEKINNHFLLNHNHIFSFSNKFYYDYNKKVIMNNNETVPLTHQEISLFELFIQNKNSLVSYDHIENSVEIKSSKNYNGVKSAVSRLRKKLPSNLIKSIYSEGYKLNHA